MAATGLGWRNARAVAALHMLAATLAAASLAGAAIAQSVEYFAVPAGSHPHDVAPAAEGGGVWFTAQFTGHLGLLDPETGETRMVPLGAGSRPHGVIVGPDGAAWVTDGGLNAIVRVDASTFEVTVFPLPSDRPNANLNTAAFDGSGVLWFTGQSGVYGRLDPATGAMEVFDAPRGRGPYGITATPSGEVYYASLAGSHIARIDVATGEATVIEPPTANQGARRVWSDSEGRVWVSEWNAGAVSVYDPEDGSWRSWRLPGARAQAYSVYVDDQDVVWLTDFRANAVVRFDPATESFRPFPSDRPNAAVRQMLGRPGEVWGAESGTDRLVRIRTR
jgi:virginiamycin B lyase